MCLCPAPRSPLLMPVPELCLHLVQVPEDGLGAVFPNKDEESRCGQYNYADILKTDCGKYLEHRGVTPDITQLRSAVRLAAQFVSTSSSDDGVVQRRRMV